MFTTRKNLYPSLLFQGDSTGQENSVSSSERRQHESPPSVVPGDHVIKLFSLSLNATENKLDCFT